MPSERVTGETVETVIHVLDKIGLCPLRIEQIIEVMDSVAAGNPSAKAAIDIALHDIYGKTAPAKPRKPSLQGFSKRHNLRLHNAYVRSNSRNSLLQS